jgi:hypothetical protein
MVRREAKRMRSLELSKDPTPHLLSSSCTGNSSNIFYITSTYHYSEAAF